MSDDDFDDMPYQALRSRCRMASLSAKGDTTTLRKRLHEHSASQTSSKRILDCTNGGAKKRGGSTARKDNADDDDDDEKVGEVSSNKQRKTLPSDDLICPITLELPWDPVFAEDGRLYEREAIEEHIATQRAASLVLKSPLTRQPMGSRLLSAPQIRNLIKTLIDSGSIEGDLAVAWKKNIFRLEHMETALKRANDGCKENMCRVAKCYAAGIGCKEDPRLAFTWFRRGHAAGCVEATFWLGICFRVGKGVRENHADGMSYVQVAAAQGSDYAAYEVGRAFFDGTWGVKKNDEKAIRWVRKSLGKCRHQHMPEFLRERARDCLRTLLKNDDPPEERERGE